jgi:hypothetical protein
LFGLSLLMAVATSSVLTQTYRSPVRTVRAGTSVFPATFARLQAQRSNALMMPGIKGSTSFTAANPVKGIGSGNSGARSRRLIRFNRRRFARLQAAEGVKGSDPEMTDEMMHGVEKTADESNAKQMNGDSDSDMNVESHGGGGLEEEVTTTEKSVSEGEAESGDAKEGPAEKMANGDTDENSKPEVNDSDAMSGDGAPTENMMTNSGDDGTTVEGDDKMGTEAKEAGEEDEAGDTENEITGEDASASSSGADNTENKAAEGESNEEKADEMPEEEAEVTEDMNEVGTDSVDGAMDSAMNDTSSGEAAEDTTVGTEEGESMGENGEVTTEAGPESGLTSMPDTNDMSDPSSANGVDNVAMGNGADLPDANEVETSENGGRNIDGPSDDLAEGINEPSMMGNGSYSFAFNTSAAVEAAVSADPKSPAAPILARQEQSDDEGNIRGSYGYMDAQGLFRHVQYEADQNGFRAKVSSNEPGLSASAGSPANVQLMLEPVPAAIQKQYGASDALKKANGNGTSGDMDEMMEAIANGTMSEDALDAMLSNGASGESGISGIGGINDDVIRVMTGGSNDDVRSGEEEEPAGELNNDEANVNENSDAELLNMSDLAGNGDVTTEPGTTTTAADELEREAGDKENGGESARLRASARLRRRMLRRYRLKRTGSAARRSSKYGAGASRLFKRKRSFRNQFAVRPATSAAARNRYFRALKAARVKRLRQVGRSAGRVSVRRRSSGRVGRRSSSSRTRLNVRTRRNRIRGSVRRTGRSSSGRSSSRSLRINRRSSQTRRLRRVRRPSSADSRRLSSRRRSSGTVRRLKRRRPTSLKRRLTTSRRLRKPRSKSQSRRKSVSTRKTKQRSRRRVVKPTVKPVYFPAPN